jgi:hypothetical protein
MWNVDETITQYNCMLINSNANPINTPKYLIMMLSKIKVSSFKFQITSIIQKTVIIITNIKKTHILINNNKIPSRYSNIFFSLSLINYIVEVEPDR